MNEWNIAVIGVICIGAIVVRIIIPLKDTLTKTKLEVIRVLCYTLAATFIYFELLPDSPKINMLERNLLGLLILLVIAWRVRVIYKLLEDLKEGN